MGFYRSPESHGEAFGEWKSPDSYGEKWELVMDEFRNEMNLNKDDMMSMGSGKRLAYMKDIAKTCLPTKPEVFIDYFGKYRRGIINGADLSRYEGSMHHILSNLQKNSNDWPVRYIREDMLERLVGVGEEIISEWEQLLNNMVQENNMKHVEQKEASKYIGQRGIIMSNFPSIYEAGHEESATALKDGINAPFVNVRISTLGGADRASLMITVSLDPRDDWKNGILENSNYFKLHLMYNGELSYISGYTSKNFRKTRVKSIQEAIVKINKYIKDIRPSEIRTESADRIRELIRNEAKNVLSEIIDGTDENTIDMFATTHQSTSHKEKLEKYRIENKERRLERARELAEKLTNIKGVVSAQLNDWNKWGSFDIIVELDLDDHNMPKDKTFNMALISRQIKKIAKGFFGFEPTLDVPKMQISRSQFMYQRSSYKEGYERSYIMLDYEF